MTARDEATVAREALIAKQIGRLRRESTILECDGRMNSARVLDEVVEVLAALESPALQPPTRKVRAEVRAGPLAFHWLRDPDPAGRVRVRLSGPGVNALWVDREELAAAQAMNALADDDGLVCPNQNADSQRCKAPPSDDPPVGKGQGRSDAPSPQTGAEKDEPDSFSAGTAFFPSIAIMYEGQQYVPKSRLDQAEREVADWKSNAERENAMLVKCQEQRDALAKRVEEGVVMWRSRLGLYQMHEPDRFERQQYGPFTRGRFVADTEDKA